MATLGDTNHNRRELETGPHMPLLHSIKKRFVLKLRVLGVQRIHRTLLLI